MTYCEKFERLFGWLVSKGEKDSHFGKVDAKTAKATVSSS